MATPLKMLPHGFALKMFTARLRLKDVTALRLRLKDVTAWLRLKDVTAWLLLKDIPHRSPEIIKHTAPVAEKI